MTLLWFLPVSAVLVVGDIAFLSFLGVLFAFLIAFRQFFTRQFKARNTDGPLRAATPEGAWCLYNLAGDPRHPGSGKQLVAQILRSADAARAFVFVDVEAEGLVTYYEHLGFHVIAEVATLWGTTSTRLLYPAKNDERAHEREAR